MRKITKDDIEVTIGRHEIRARLVIENMKHYNADHMEYEERYGATHYIAERLKEEIWRKVCETGKTSQGTEGYTSALHADT